MNHIGNLSTSGQRLIGVLLKEHDFIKNKKAFVAKFSNLLYDIIYIQLIISSL